MEPPKDDKARSVASDASDPAKVEEFRKEIGILPLSQYLDMLKQVSGAKEVVFERD